MFIVPQQPGSTLTAWHFKKTSLKPLLNDKMSSLLYISSLSIFCHNVAWLQGYNFVGFNENTRLQEVTKAVPQLHFQSYKGELLTRILYFHALFPSPSSPAFTAKKRWNKGAWLTRPDFNSSPFSTTRGEEDLLHKDEEALPPPLEVCRCTVEGIFGSLAVGMKRGVQKQQHKARTRKRRSTSCTMVDALTCE